ncbi:MAG: hypothetical protein Q9227_006738 [Pyrenula ochraceoflavens]
MSVEATPQTSESKAEIPQSDGASQPFQGSSLEEPEYTVDVKLSDLQADPNNPLFSVKSFDELGLSPEILKGIISMNFTKPSKVQERALPLLLSNPPKNMVGQSQSGTGKTAAFTLNILSRLDLSTPQMQQTPQALVLAPTRELARQIHGVILLMGTWLQGLDVKIAIPQDRAQRILKYDCSVVVGTPGTVVETIKRKYLNPASLKVLVLDEADNMLDLQGLGDQCSRCRSLVPSNVQILLFSATFPDHVVRYAQSFAPNANELTLRHQDLTVEGIRQIYLDCESDQEKYDVLVKFYGLLTIGSSIIFVKTKESAREIQRRMTEEGHRVVSLTGELQGADRDAIIDKFRLGAAKVLIATNVLSRGIDVESVSMVVNYDVPDRPVDGTIGGPLRFEPDPQTYLHRIGRTGRFGRVGVAVTFVSSRRDWEMLMSIQQYFGTEMTKVETGDWDEVEEQVSKIIKSSRAGSNFKGA